MEAWGPRESLEKQGPPGPGSCGVGPGTPTRPQRLSTPHHGALAPRWRCTGIALCRTGWGLRCTAWQGSQEEAEGPWERAGRPSHDGLVRQPIQDRVEGDGEPLGALQLWPECRRPVLPGVQGLVWGKRTGARCRLTGTDTRGQPDGGDGARPCLPAPPRCGRRRATGHPHPLARAIAASLTHPHTCSYTLTHTPAHTLAHTHTPILAHSRTHSLRHTHTWLTHALTRSFNKHLLFGNDLPGTVDRGILNFRLFCTLYLKTS